MPVLSLTYFFKTTFVSGGKRQVNNHKNRNGTATGVSHYTGLVNGPVTEYWKEPARDNKVVQNTLWEELRNISESH